MVIKTRFFLFALHPDAGRSVPTAAVLFLLEVLLKLLVIINILRPYCVSWAGLELNSVVSDDECEDYRPMPLCPVYSLHSC